MERSFEKFLFTLCCVGFGALAATMAIFTAWELVSTGFDIKNSCGKEVGNWAAIVMIAQMTFFAVLAWRAK
jgi:hypothetical protein